MLAFVKIEFSKEDVVKGLVACAQEECQACPFLNVCYGGKILKEAAIRVIEDLSFEFVYDL